MDFNLTTEQEALSDSVRRFVERDYGFDKRRAIMDSADGISAEIWNKMAELGWFGAGLSEDAGGFGGGAVENALIAEGLGRGLVVEPFIANAVLTLQTLAALGPFEGREVLVEGIVAGTHKAVLAHGEADARGNPRIVATKATKADGSWSLSGAKSLVLGAPSADTLIVSARTGPGDGDISLFRVDPAAAGLSANVYRLLDNSRVSDLKLDGVVGTLIGPEGGALSAIEAGIDHATVTLCAEAVGAMDTALFMTRDYLKTRQQFGQPIGNFQALQHRMADMLVELELARSMVFQGLAALVEGDADQRRRGVSASKVMIGDAGLFVGRQSIQLHGGIGMTEEYAIGHYYRRLFVIAGLFGNADIHLVRYGDLSWAA
ncbi:acyl-CoA dehydrogenase family protein [Novosphingobium cyanobacteriorum]|uniref:Acyl-CoA dehydrogenase family protein n=1 Tax=Novosphingobium cyanobacteriorum TaxID=3024215 RepID=A0ABT6CM38_9SPHN|nr:acyl-CoA dehydrogenase family protein [Novosphingobium cyanobacteriorum]MDF8334594.1 acyl-CoA dehydrogenase family protein [Novosphingobium cyanobacteriorum]